jgi:hypothetical protein
MSNPDRFRALLSTSALVALGFISTTPVMAQKSTTRGLHLGVHLQAASLQVQEADPASGGGLGVRVGYGINRFVTLYAEADGIQVEAGDPERLSGDWGMAHAELGARVHFANSLRGWVPYVGVALGSRVVSVDNAQALNQDVGTVDFNGGAFSFGFGVYAYFTETVALEAGVKVSSGEFTEIDIGPYSIEGLDIDAQSTRFKVGVVWWP